MHFWPKKIIVYAIRQRTNVLFMLTLGRTCKFIPPPWYKGGGWKPPLEFFICCSISKRWKPLIVAFPGGLWRHQQWSPSWVPSWILPRIGNQDKTARNGNFFVLEMKYNPQISTLHDFSHKIYFYCWKNWKNIYFHSKMVGAPPPHWTLLKMRARDEQKAPENIRCWCFIH